MTPEFPVSISSAIDPADVLAADQLELCRLLQIRLFGSSAGTLANLATSP
jgi:hypothetical protein